jgi:hypothetical protein
VHSKAEAEASVSDIGDVVAGMEGVVDGGQRRVGGLLVCPSVQI